MSDLPSSCLSQPSPGLTLTEIAKLNNHSIGSVCKAVRRFKLTPVMTVGRINLYSKEQAEYLREHMREGRSLINQ